MKCFTLEKIRQSREHLNCFPVRKLKVSEIKIKTNRGVSDIETARITKNYNFMLDQAETRIFKRNRGSQNNVCSPVIVRLKQKSRELMSPYSISPGKQSEFYDSPPVKALSKLPGLIPRSKTRPKMRYF